jgi:hypothetical protein
MRYAVVVARTAVASFIDPTMHASPVVLIVTRSVRNIPVD